MSDRPGIVLDIEGVLNVYRFPLEPDKKDRFYQVRYHPVFGEFRYPAGVIQALDEFILRNGVQLYWLLDRGEDRARAFSEQAGFRSGVTAETLGVRPFEYEGYPSMAWKLPKMWSFLKGNESRIVWVDDDISVRDLQVLSPYNVRTIGTNPYVGLTWENLAALKDALGLSEKGNG